MTFEEALHISSMRPSTTIGMLQAGRDLLSIHGVWVQNGGDLEHRCAVTSMWRKFYIMEEKEAGNMSIWTDTHEDDRQSYMDAIAELRETLVADGEYGVKSVFTVSVAGWNDREGRTVEDVLSLFDRTIAQLEVEAAADV